MSAEDRLEHLFPGAELTHLLTVVADDALLGLKTVVEALASSGAALHGVSVAPLGGASVQQIRLGSLQPQAARELARRLADLPGVNRASVEHHLARPPQAAGAN